jgi:AraC-like DNA-binding protein
MTPERFATHSLPVPDQLEAWRGWLHSVFDMMPRRPLDAGFPAECKLWKVGSLAISRVSAPAIQLSRTKTLIRRNPVDHWVITLSHRVTMAVRTGDASLEAPAGLPIVLSLGNELVSERSQDDRLLFYLPRDSFREIAPALDATRGTVLNTPRGKLLGDYMAWLEGVLPDLMPEDLPQLTGAVRAMVAACIMPSSDHVAIAASQIDLGRLESVRRAVRSHLHSPSLGSDMLCRQLATSRSQLYRLLEGEGGVARYIQRQRLLESHAALCDTSSTKPIAAIAEELCFADGSGFSRAFRHEFGMSPSDVRAASLAGLAPAAVPKARVGPELLKLGDCLRSF